MVAFWEFWQKFCGLKWEDEFIYRFRDQLVSFLPISGIEVGDLISFGWRPVTDVWSSLRWSPQAIKQLPQASVEAGKMGRGGPQETRDSRYKWSLWVAVTVAVRWTPWNCLCRQTYPSWPWGFLLSPTTFKKWAEKLWGPGTWSTITFYYFLTSGFVLFFIRYYIQSLISWNYRSKIALFTLYLILFKSQQFLIFSLNISYLWLIRILHTWNIYKGNCLNFAATSNRISVWISKENRNFL